ncbi:MAG: RagB/SusD family nutrient uptake outer membrane protein [Candidatus Cyclobacteriaceae bacterium M3_2C_046]
MKSTINKITILALLFFMGCGQEYLEPYDELVLTVPEYYASLDEESIESITANMYGFSWFNYLDKASSCLQELYCGNGWTDDGAYLPFFNGTLNSAFNQLDFIWTTNYGIIKNANESINGFDRALQEGTEFQQKVNNSASLKTSVNSTIGELRFFRAISYFNLVKWYGAVPLIYDNTVQLTDLTSLTPIIESDIYKFIIMDLEDAIDKLPANRNSGEPNKLSKVSAQALLAKVYLTRAGESYAESNDFPMAAQLAEEVINNNAGYRLMNTYHENFLPEYNLSNFPEECLWGWKWSWVSLFGSYGTQNTLQSYFGSSHFTQSWDGWSAVVPSVDLLESYEAGDLRRYSTIMEHGNYYPEFWTEYTFPGMDEPGYVYYDGSVSWGGPRNTGTHIRKHLAGRDNSADGHIGEMHTEVYTPMIRIADLYLTYAEAVLGKNSSTSDAKALQYFNTIRKRAGLENLNSITYRDIWNERRHEFAFEFQNTDDLFRYYNLYPQEVKNMLLAQKRGTYKMTTEQVIIDGVPAEFPAGQPLKKVNSREYLDFKLPVVTEEYFRLPYPISEINGNMNWDADPVGFNFEFYK